MANVEARRQKEAAEEQERRRQAKLAAKNPTPQPKKPKFDFEREKPKVMVSVANAIQCANNLVNSCRVSCMAWIGKGIRLTFQHINREHESLTESPKVQDNLDKAKAARRVIIRYIQLVQEEEYVGTLLDANEKVVEAIQLYDKVRTHSPSAEVEALTISFPSPLRWIPTLMARAAQCLKKPSRLRLSTSVFKLRNSRPTGLARFSSCKMRKRRSLPDDSDHRSRGKLRLLVLGSGAVGDIQT